jgi:hypothetical protein
MATTNNTDPNKKYRCTVDVFTHYNASVREELKSAGFKVEKTTKFRDTSFIPFIGTYSEIREWFDSNSFDLDFRDFEHDMEDMEAPQV